MKKKWLWVLLLMWVLYPMRVWWWQTLDKEVVSHMVVMYDTGNVAMWWILSHVDKMRNISTISIGSILTKNNDPERALLLYQNDIRHVLRQQSLWVQDMSSKREEQRRVQQTCLQQKRTSDARFFAATRQHASGELLERLTDESASHAACAEQARVKIRAYTVIMQQANTHNITLQKRLRVLQANSSFLIQNAWYVGSNPSNMIRINQLIRQLD